jgi:hypothetical protein
MTSIAARIGEVKERYDQIERATDFAQIARLMLASKGRLEGARDLAREPRISDRVRRIFADPGAADVFVRRAIVPPMAISGNAPLTEYRIAANGFAASLANVGLFDRMLAGGFRVVPLRLLTVGASTAGAVAAVVDEGAPKVVSNISLSSAQTTPRKAAAIIVLTAELARAAEGVVDNLVGQELKNACIKAIDQKFWAIATAGAPSFASSGTNVAAFFGDLAAALNAVGVDDTSRLFIAMTSVNAKMLSLMLAQGSTTSTALTPSGGTVAGIEVVISDALAAGQWALIDASGFAAAADLLQLSTLAHASIDLQTSPDSPATPSTNFYSLWQLNQVALLAERFFIAEKLRTNSVAVINSASYAGGFSP